MKNKHTGLCVFVVLLKCFYVLSCGVGLVIWKRTWLIDCFIFFSAVLLTVPFSPFCLFWQFFLIDFLFFPPQPWFSHWQPQQPWVAAVEAASTLPPWILSTPLPGASVRTSPTLPLSRSCKLWPLTTIQQQLLLLFKKSAPGILHFV